MEPRHPGIIARQKEAMKPRLFPTIPPNRYLCFYPMDRRRGEDKNWYTLPMEERQRQMNEHGLVGRRYAGEVKQIITGSIGLMIGSGASTSSPTIPGFQEAHLRDALRPSQRRLCIVRKFLYRIASSGEPPLRLAGGKPAVVDQLPVPSTQLPVFRAAATGYEVLAT